MPVATDVLGCLVRRIWAHQVSLFVSRSRDIDHPGSGSAQGLLSLAHAWSHFWKAAPQHPQRFSHDCFCCIPFPDRSRTAPLFSGPSLATASDTELARADPHSF